MDALTSNSTRWFFAACMVVLPSCGSDDKPTASTTPVVDQVFTVKTALPKLPAMTSVKAFPNDDSARVTFDPVDGAVDYRIYPLPKDSDIQLDGDGRVVVKNALYRCSGIREAASVQVEDQELPSAYMRTLVDGNEVGGYTRTLEEANLGYVYATPGVDRTPVYALGDSNALMDNCCYAMRWEATRVKTYTTSETERDTLLAKHFRDDGIAFYVPAESSSETKTVFTDTLGQTNGEWTKTELFGSVTQARFYFPEGPEASAHPDRQAAFNVLAAKSEGTVPLMRVFYSNSGGASHDELVAGNERFERVRRQGATQAFWGLNWTGITKETTLVVEALDGGCPFQGIHSVASVAAEDVPFGDTVLNYPAYTTLDEMRAQSATGEVFLNGQHDTSTLPKAIARSFVVVKPEPHEEMDFFASFGPEEPKEKFTAQPCVNTDPDVNFCYASTRMQSDNWDISGDGLRDGTIVMGEQLGEFWMNYADDHGDTGGQVRMVPRKQATLSDDSYVHVTMEVDAFSTRRRYPQIFISNADVPIQQHMLEGTTLVVQTFDGWPHLYQLEMCDHRDWGPNNQCPVYDFFRVKNGGIDELAPVDELSELIGETYRLKFDVYASTKRTYLMLNGKPYGCALLPEGKMTAGPVNIVYGDVLYHSSADVFEPAFHQKHMNFVTRRHFDNLGFSSNVAAPAWDSERFPCQDPVVL